MGHEIGKGQIRPVFDTITKFPKQKKPETRKQIPSFLGLPNYYRQFVPAYAEILQPLIAMTRKWKPINFHWKKDKESASDALKVAVSSKPVLLAPDATKPFILGTDASKTGMGVVLMQEHYGLLLPIAYVSK